MLEKSEKLESLTNSSGSFEGNAMPNIDGLNDIFDAIEICDQYDVPYDGLEDMDDFIERLRLHFNKKHQPESRKKQIEKSMQKAGKDDAKRRQRLISYTREMMTILNKEGPDMSRPKRDSELLGGLLKVEGTSQDLDKDCAARIADMQSQECLFIVAGETSAGKSSVLNLLFEDDILPVHNNSSTSVITIVRYDKRRHARIVYKNGQPDVVFDLDAEGMKKLHAIAFMKNASEREYHEIKEVQVFLPLPLLQSGLVLVDTPGIGENEFLEKELVNFISSRQILGFIYIIKTDNAGGVQEDRLLNLLKIVVTKQQKGSKKPIVTNSARFDPKAALFVCNRFDLVNKEELEKVKQNAKDKLKDCWPCFHESQVIFFSTDKAKRDFEADEDYINDNYQQLLNALSDLFSLALERRIKDAFKWIENVLKRTVYHLKSMVKRLDLTDMELVEKSDDARKKLESLKQKSDSLIEELNDIVDESAKDLCVKLRKYIKTPMCKYNLTTKWSIADIPKVESGLGDWKWIRGKIHEAFYDKLVNCVENWDENEGNIDKIEEHLAHRIKGELRLLEEELQEIEREIDGDSASDTSDTLIQLSKSRRRASTLTFSPMKTKFLLQEPKLPNKLSGRILAPLTGFMKSIKNSLKESDYKKDPVQVAQIHALEIYTDLINESTECFMAFVNNLLDRPRQYINAVERKIPDIILANQMSLNRFQFSIDAERKFQESYADQMTKTEALKRSLMEYGEGYIFVDDFTKSEIQISYQTEDGFSVSVPFKVSDFLRSSSDELVTSRQRDIRGLWTVIYSGDLVRNGVEMPVAIRVYLPSSGVKFTFKEVAKLRCLTRAHPNVAEFLGIHDAGAPTPAFVYVGGNCGLKTVRRFLSSFCFKRECVPDILEETACALEYLHHKGLVHMELTQDTITVDENGSVQLTGACLPRVARLPDSTESIESGSFVYLAPEVLRGEQYEACADIYSFGLLIIELVQADVPVVFKEQRKMTLCDFIKNVNPEKMMELEEIVEIFTIKTRALIQNCLSVDKDSRPLMSEVFEFTCYIRKERDALQKLPSRRSRAIIKRPSAFSVSVKGSVKL